MIPELWAGKIDTSESLCSLAAIYTAHRCKFTLRHQMIVYYYYARPRLLDFMFSCRSHFKKKLKKKKNCFWSVTWNDECTSHDCTQRTFRHAASIHCVKEFVCNSKLAQTLVNVPKSLKIIYFGTQPLQVVLRTKSNCLDFTNCKYDFENIKKHDFRITD